MRVKIRIDLDDRSTEAIALINTAFEGDVPEVLVPIQLAERLNVWPSLPGGTIVETYRSVSGLMRVYRIRGAKVSLVAEGIKPRYIDSYLVISEQADEVLINDQLISSLGLVIEDPAKGLWRIKGEEKIRKSEPYRFS